MPDHEQFRAWLTDAGIESEPVEVLPEFRWGLRTAGHPYGVTIGEKDSEWPTVMMEIRLAVSPQHAEALEAVTEDERDAFVYDLRMALLRQPVGQAIEFDEETGLMARVVLGTQLMEDPITRAGFFRRHHQLQTSGIIVSQLLKRLDRFRSWSV